MPAGEVRTEAPGGRDSAAAAGGGFGAGPGLEARRPDGIPPRHAPARSELRHGRSYGGRGVRRPRHACPALAEVLRDSPAIHQSHTVAAAPRRLSPALSSRVVSRSRVVLLLVEGTICREITDQHHAYESAAAVRSGAAARG